MKSYNHLYEICISDENRRKSIKKAKHSKRIRRIIKKRHLSDDALLAESLNLIEKFQNAKHTPIEIYDGVSRKKRKIVVPTLEELIVQHCVVNALMPVFWRGMYEHSYGSLPGRGAHKGKKVIEKWIRTDPKNTKYVLKMDIHHFFDSIPHDILKRKLEKKIHDEKMLDLLFRIIDVTDEGIPLGFYTSQWLSNWYLQELDHFIKEKLHAAHYIRYMDDMVIFGSNKKVLHQMREVISQYLCENLGLKLKKNWQVYRFSYGEDKGRDLDFMGFRFYRNRTVLRKTILYKATRKANRIAKKTKPTIHDAHQMISYLGMIDCTNTYGIYVKRIKPSVNFQKLKRKISFHDRNSDAQIYARFVAIYTAKGGKQNGTRLYLCGKHRKTTNTRTRC